MFPFVADNVGPKGRVENLKCLCCHRARLIHADVELGEFLRNADRRADLKSPVRNMVEHADLFDDARRTVVRDDDAHDAQPNS